jgi:hypothetical protein
VDYTLQVKKLKLVALFLSIFIASYFDELYANTNQCIVKLARARLITAAGR